jgi:hypothetical protein
MVWTAGGMVHLGSIFGDEKLFEGNHEYYGGQLGRIENIW